MMSEEQHFLDWKQHVEEEKESIEGEQSQSTAEQRPSAYVPEEIGVPKPFGAFAPFKPSEPGSTMRHIRKPQPREIEL